MSAGVSAGGPSNGRGGPVDFELNLASIIDCFTVLIAFLLVSASFLSIGVLDAGVSAAGAASNNAKPPEVNCSIELRKDHSFVVKLGGKASGTYTLPAKGGKWDLAALAAQLHTVKGKYPALAGATLVADDSIEYLDVVKSMETTRKTLPAVLLGGF